MTSQTTRPDVYTRITAGITAQLEAGGEALASAVECHAFAGEITRPRRNNGQPYQGINVLVLWLTAFQKLQPKPHRLYPSHA